MEKSESIKELATALAAAQAEMPAAEMKSYNKFLKNKFADLGSIISTAKPILEKHGLSISQLPVTTNDDASIVTTTTNKDGEIITTTTTSNVGVTTILMHTSGEWISSTVTLPIGEEKGKSLAQVAGSIITYLRRYSVAAALGMYAEEDGDGNAPGQGKKGTKKTTRPPARKAATPKADPVVEAAKERGAVVTAPVPTNATQLYEMAHNDLGINPKDAAGIIAAWTKENHGTSNVSEYIGAGGTWAALWGVLKASV